MLELGLHFSHHIDAPAMFPSLAELNEREVGQC